MPSLPRVVSMVPAGTEIVGALGLTGALVAVSHDCDHPAGIEGLPKITRCELDELDLPSGEVEAWVDRTLAERGTLYTIDEDLLRTLQPDLILTQKLCDVCAPSYGSVAHLASTLSPAPDVLNLEPETLPEILGNVATVAGALGAPQVGADLVARLEARIAAVRERARGVHDRPRTALLEWIEPLYRAGHWNPTLVALAGGHDVLGRSGEPSSRASWDELVEADPETIVVSACGYGVWRTWDEMPSLAARDGWASLAAVRNDAVYVVDGGAYFSRPGPRIVDSLELLAGILHPKRFPEFAPPRRAPGQVRRWPAARTA